MKRLAIFLLVLLACHPAFAFRLRGGGTYTTTSLGISDPSGTSPTTSVWQQNNQIIPYSNGATTSALVQNGTNATRPVVQVDIGFFSDSGCTTQVGSWTAVTPSTATTTQWAATVTVPNGQSFLHVQARDHFNNPDKSACSTNVMMAGDVTMTIGQSYWQKMQDRSDTDTSASTNTSGAISTSQFVFGTDGSNQSPVGFTVTGTNIQANTTVSAVTDGFHATVSPVPTATGSSLSLTINGAPPSTDAWSYRFAGGNGPYPVSDAFHTGEQEPNMIANADGEIMLANKISESLGGGEELLEYGQGSQSICAFLGGTHQGNCGADGAMYQTIFTLSATDIVKIGNDFSNVVWDQGVQDAGQTQAWYTTNLTALEALLDSKRANVPFGISPDTQGSTNNRQSQLAYIDNNASGNVYYVPWQADLSTSDYPHLYPFAYARWAKRVTQAYLRFRGASTSGYGPKISSFTATHGGGSTISVNVTQEAGSALRSKGQSTSGSGLTGFNCLKNASAYSISSTSFTQPATVVLTMASSYVDGDTLQCAYQDPATQSLSNIVYDNMPPFSDTDGLPLQPTRGTNGLMTVSH